MPKEKLDLIVEGGKATSTPQLAQKLGPLKINISEVLKKINEKTNNFLGIKVPLKLTIDTGNKEVEIDVGTPPVSQLIKKELNIEVGSGTPNMNKVGNLGIEQVIKIAKMKSDSMFIKNVKSAVKSIIGSAHSAGILIEGMPAQEINPLIESGRFDNEIKKEITETSKEKRAQLDEQLTIIQETLKRELEKQKALEEAEKVKVAEPEKAEEAKAEVKEVKEVKKEEAKEIKGKEQVKGKEPIKETKSKEAKK